MTKWQRMEKKAGGRNLYGTRGRGSFWAGRRAAGVSTCPATAMQQTQSLGSVTGFCHSLFQLQQWNLSNCVNFYPHRSYFPLSVQVMRCRCPLLWCWIDPECGTAPVARSRWMEKKILLPSFPLFIYLLIYGTAFSAQCAHHKGGGIWSSYFTFELARLLQHCWNIAKCISSSPQQQQQQWELALSWILLQRLFPFAEVQ